MPEIRGDECWFWCGRTETSGPSSPTIGRTYSPLRQRHSRRRVLEIAGGHGKSAAQVMLRRQLQEGRSAIPKSTKPTRIAESFDVFDFELAGDEIAAIDALDTGARGGPDPDSITLASHGREIPEA